MSLGKGFRLQTHLVGVLRRIHLAFRGDCIHRQAWSSQVTTNSFIRHEAQCSRGSSTQAASCWEACQVSKGCTSSKHNEVGPERDAGGTTDFAQQLSIDLRLTERWENSRLQVGPRGAVADSFLLKLKW